jgi:hypothetical protein
MISVEKPGTPYELVHHGIKGMHWGVRKKEETSGQQSARPEKKLSDRKLKKIETHETNARIAQTRIDQINADRNVRDRKKRIKQLEKFRDQNQKDANAIREGHLTSHQKKVLIGAGVVVGLLAIYGTYKLIDSGSLHQIVNKKQLAESTHLLKKNMTADEIMHTVVKPINPNYGEVGTKMNCRRCTFAYELRRRGYDVKATKSASGTGQTVAGLLNAIEPGSDVGTSPIGILTQLAKERKSGGDLTALVNQGGGLGRSVVDFGPRTVRTLAGNEVKVPLSTVEKTEVLFKHLAQYPDRSRGELGVKWAMGGAHSMAWEVIDGVPHVFDTQTGTSYNAKEFLDKLGPSVSEAGTTRLDNVGLNGKFLGKWIRNVK